MHEQRRRKVAEFALPRWLVRYAHASSADAAVDVADIFDLDRAFVQCERGDSRGGVGGFSDLMAIHFQVLLSLVELSLPGKRRRRKAKRKKPAGQVTAFIVSSNVRAFEFPSVIEFSATAGGDFVNAQ